MNRFFLLDEKHATEIKEWCQSCEFHNQYEDQMWAECRFQHDYCSLQFGVDALDMDNFIANIHRTQWFIPVDWYRFYCCIHCITIIVVAEIHFQYILFRFIFITSRKYIFEIMAHIYYSLITWCNLSWVCRIQQHSNRISYFCVDKIRPNWICVSHSYVQFVANCAHCESQPKACWANGNGIVSTEDKPRFEFPLYQWYTMALKNERNRRNCYPFSKNSFGNALIRLDIISIDCCHQVKPKHITRQYSEKGTKSWIYIKQLRHSSSVIAAIHMEICRKTCLHKVANQSNKS